MTPFCEQLITGLASATVGGFIGGYCALKATANTIKHERQKIQDQEKRIEFGFLQAIHDEVDILWSRYTSNNGIGVQLEALQPNQPMLVYFPIAQDYFPVYRGNTSLIGQIRDNELRRLIVAVYTKAAGMIDNVRMNNELVGKQEYWHMIFQQSGQNHASQMATQFLNRCAPLGP